MNISDRTQNYLKMMGEKFELNCFKEFAKDLLNLEQDDIINGNDIIEISEQYKNYIDSVQIYASYEDNKKRKIGVIIIKIKDNKNPANARTLQRNYIARILGDYSLDAVLAAIYSNTDDIWRLSLVKQEIDFGSGKFQTKFTPAKRYSYLLGKGEPNHTAKKQLLDFIEKNEQKYSLEELEEKFSVEKVTKEFFENYKENYLRLYENLENNKEFIEATKKYGFTTEEFAKKLMGQIVFLYFLQKKGWLGVSLVPSELSIEEYNDFYKKEDSDGKKVLNKYYITYNNSKKLKGILLKFLKENEQEIAKLSDIFVGSKYDGDWGTGKKNFIRELFKRYKDLVAPQAHNKFFDDYLEPFFYNGLNYKRRNQYFSVFNCKIPSLNGGLFEPIDNYLWELSDFKIEDDIFSNKDETGILDFFDRYNFTINEEEPLEKDVAVDPEMLGKIFENLLDVKDRKSKGAFYTPREIVHYMCKESIANFLVNKVGVKYEEIKDFIQYGELIKDIDLKEATKEQHLVGDTIFKNVLNIDKALANIKIADPAVGSGAFPLGILNEIVKLRDILTSYMVIYNKFGLFDKVYSEEQIRSEKRSLYQLKWDAIKNNIYAVDIENSAVDITKLRLWLSVVVDQDKVKKSGPEPLPNLDCKIMQGNSLIDEYNGIKLIDEKFIDDLKDRENVKFNETNGIIKDYKGRKVFVSDTQIALGDGQKKAQIDGLIRYKQELYETTNPERKKELIEKIQNVRKELLRLNFIGTNKEKELFEVDKSHNKPYFAWMLEYIEVFIENDGFDIVIGNPPYVDSEHMVKDENLLKTRELCNKLYSSAKGNWDLFIVFIELGYNYLNEKGNVSFIIPNKIIASNYAKAIRKIMSNNSLIEIRDYSNVNVFKEAAVYPVTFISNKENNIKFDYVRMLKMKDMTNIDWENDIDRNIFMQNDNWDNFFAKNSEANKIISRIVKENKKLSEIAEIKGAATVSEAYIVKEKLYENKEIVENIEFKFINTGTIDPYTTTWGDGKTQYIKQSYLQPVISKVDLKNISEQRYLEASAEKIIIGGMTKILECFYDDGKCLAGKSTTIVYNSSKNLKFIIGILNSRFMSRFYQIYFNSLSLAGGFYRIGAPQIKDLPIPDVSKENEKKIIALVDKIILNPNDEASKKEIDEYVYSIYKIDTNEIKVLEEE